MSDTIIRLVDAEIDGKNWVHFTAFAGKFDVNRTYVIKYCGTEIQLELPLTEKGKESLLHLLQEKFQYAPFSINEVKMAIGEGLDLYVDYK